MEQSFQSAELLRPDPPLHLLSFFPDGANLYVVPTQIVQKSMLQFDKIFKFTLSRSALGQTTLAAAVVACQSYARSAPYNPTMTVAQDGITHRLYIWQVE